MENQMTQSTNHFIPTVSKSYVRWGNFEKISKVVASKRFAPMWINGPTGNGKSSMVAQVCAEHTRPLIRVNFTAETSEDDLIGGFRLKNGDTEFHEGPVVTALRVGGILLLDDLDMAHTNKVLCLLTVLEGEGVLIKATGEYVRPAAGFNIFATSNTQGRGSEDGRYIGTNIMNAAFLDRFAAQIMQEWPTAEIEQDFLRKYFIDYAGSSDEFNTAMDKMTDTQRKQFATDETKWIGKLVKWAGETRLNFSNQTQTEFISPRSLINIIQCRVIFNDKDYAVKLACDRYDPATAEGFYSLYKKLSDDSFVEEKPVEEKKPSKSDWLEINPV
jgi:MoxR-like ATPase